VRTLVKVYCVSTQSIKRGTKAYHGLMRLSNTLAKVVQVSQSVRVGRGAKNQNEIEVLQLRPLGNVEGNRSKRGVTIILMTETSNNNNKKCSKCLAQVALALLFARVE